MMRYVNRRRLLIVSALAALLGAALPYALLVLSWEFPDINKEDEDDIPWIGRNFTMDQTHSPLIDTFRVVYELSDIPEEEDAAEPQIRGLVPRDAFDPWLQSYGLVQMNIIKIGLPFRAIHACTLYDRATRKTSATSTSWAKAPTGWKWADDRLPAFVPNGVIWSGLLGNVCASIATFGSIYCGLAYVRARRRTRRGKCYKCGYLSSGAAVCPECGVGVKA